MIKIIDSGIWDHTLGFMLSPYHWHMISYLISFLISYETCNNINHDIIHLPYMMSFTLISLTFHLWAHLDSRSTGSARCQWSSCMLSSAMSQWQPIAHWSSLAHWRCQSPLTGKKTSAVLRQICRGNEALRERRRRFRLIWLGIGPVLNRAAVRMHPYNRRRWWQLQS